MSIHYQIAGTADLPVLADLRWRLCHEDRAETGDRAGFIDTFIRQVPAGDASAPIVHWLARQDGRVIAALSVVRVAKLPAPDDLAGEWGYLTNVFVLSNYRNRGIGSALLAAVVDWARSQRLELLAVWPSERSFPFYFRAGFRRGDDPLVLALQATGSE